MVKACKNVAAEIWVVDNLSTDGSREYFADKFTSVQFIWNDANIGFAKANNMALKLATGKYILFLNPDTILPEDCIEKSLAFLNTADKAGGMGIRMIDGSGKYLPESKRGFPSPLTSVFKLCGLCSLFPKSATFAKYYLGNLPENTNNEIDVLAGAYMLMPKIVLDKTGGFDESFFMYGEDIDLSYRIQQAGYKNYYFAESTIIHFKGESTQKENMRYLDLFYGAMILFVKKHYNKRIAGVYGLFIRMALNVKSMLATIKSFLSNPSGDNNNHLKTEASLVVVADASYNIIEGVLQSGLSKMKITGRLVPLVENNKEAIGNLSQIQSFIKEHAASEVVFCEPDLSFKQIISVLQDLPKDISFKFHAAGSNSIVGSNSKNSRGEFISFT